MLATIIIRTITEIRKQLLNKDKRPTTLFNRDSNGNKIVLLMRSAHGMLPVEVKSSATSTSSFLKGIEHIREVSPGTAPHDYVFLKR